MIDQLRSGLFVVLVGSVGSACYQGASVGDGETDSTSSSGPTTTSPTSSPTSPTSSPTSSASSTSASGTASTTETTTSPTSTTDTTTSESTDTGSTTTAEESSSSSSGDDTGPPVVPPCPYDAVVAPSGFTLELVAEDLGSPLFALGHPTEPDRLFVLEQDGTIEMIEPGTTVPVDPPILTIDDVLSGGERGLLGLAFHPDFPNDPRIYVNYTADPDGRTRIEEYVLDPDADWVADPKSARIVTEIYQPAPNHNGGGIAFDPDGWLVIGMGDGGTSSTSRDTGIVLSKFLRIGVEPDGTADDPPACDGCPTYGPWDYTIPDDNPFVGQAEYAAEILAVGFRNPWRWSIDVQDGTIWVGDVGEVSWEEVDIVEAGRDYGWVDMEGSHCLADGDCDDAAAPHAENADGLTMPLTDVSHTADCAIIGGAVYHSCQVPEWDGIYFFTDYCNRDVRGLTWDGAAVDELGLLVDPSTGFLGNGWNAWGDVYLTGGGIEGTVWRVAPLP